MEKRILDLFVILFFLFSFFYLIKNTLWGEFNLSTVKVYKNSINNLKELLKKEKEKHRKLEEEYETLLVAENNTLKAFIRDYLFYIEPDEQILLRPPKGGE